MKWNNEPPTELSVYKKVKKPETAERRVLVRPDSGVAP